nr:AAA family ATPase [Microvirga makkahensis]
MEREQLTGIPGQVQGILERKGQVILYGPPGTGKTHWARAAAADLASLATYKKRYEALGPTDRAIIDGDDTHRGLVRLCTFHPGYGYEDFLEGYRPHSNQDGQLVFERRSGIFKQLCADAAVQPEKNFYLIIDEINRGDIPRIFGELITLLEADKRGVSLHLPLSGERFSVPKNVYIIGTMNTADRSIALLDTALRRRFGFVELLPQPTLLSDAVVAGSIPLSPWLSAINDKIRQHVGRDARNLQIGHAYLLHRSRPITDLTHFSRVLLEDIIPLLEEYCYEDYSALEKILGSGLVDKDRQRIREELFSPSRSQDLIQAVLNPHSELATLGQVVSASGADDINEEDSEEDETTA